MPDHLTPSQRHTCMSHIRGKNTTPEMVVRRYLHAHGFRYSLHRKNLPGTPDIVLRKYKTVIFVNGCFWHGHQLVDEVKNEKLKIKNCPYYVLPKGKDPLFWKHKIELNQARDYRVRVDLELLGWKVITIWECELKKEQRDETLNKLIKALKPCHHKLTIQPKRNGWSSSRSDTSVMLLTVVTAEDAECLTDLCQRKSLPTTSKER